ncbi:MAG TPA: hypothetical protein VF519_14360 [Mycobacteriales bacterium]|jgi:hypothetical protein
MPARVDLDGHDVVVTITGSDRLWALKRELRIPRNQITNAVAVDRKAVPRAWLRLGGTSLLGVISAGRFWGRGGMQFRMYRGGRRLLMIETTGSYPRVVLETDDPAGDADRILAAR